MKNSKKTHITTRNALGYGLAAITSIGIIIATKHAQNESKKAAFNQIKEFRHIASGHMIEITTLAERITFFDTSRVHSINRNIAEAQFAYNKIVTIVEKYCFMKDVTAAKSETILDELRYVKHQALVVESHLDLLRKYYDTFTVDNNSNMDKESTDAEEV